MLAALFYPTIKQKYFRAPIQKCFFILCTNLCRKIYMMIYKNKNGVNTLISYKIHKPAVFLSDNNNYLLI